MTTSTKERPMTRAKRTESEKMKPVAIGESDTMSRLVRSMLLPVCGNASAAGSCTRAAGHDESTQKHAGTDHVHAPRPSYAVTAVWS